MNALTSVQRPADWAVQAGMDRYEDPLDADASTDVFVPATRRGLTRLALIAAETGARFQREGAGAPDPMAWLLAPRRLFNGSAAIEACLRSREFSRALLLHGLSLGLDADPDEIDDLIDEDAGGGFEGADPPDAIAAVGVVELPADRPAVDGAALRLFTATIVYEDGGMSLHAFHASIGGDRAEIVERIVERYGPAPARTARIQAGYDPTTAFAEALVSPALSDMLQLVDAEPASPIAAGLDLNLEQRFAA